METTDGLIGTSSGRSTVAPGECPACGRAGSGPPASPEIQLFDGAAVWRCAHCSARSLAGASGPKRIHTCKLCGLPSVLADPAGERTCADCRGGKFEPDPPDQALTRATEGEVRSVLAAAWTFVEAPGVTAYLDQVARQMAREIEGSPPNVEVQLFDDDAQRTLALPSGTLFVSRGTLQELGNEAELAFVLGHEIAHLASGSTRHLLFRMALRGLAQRDRGEHREAWGRAALDLLALGHGSDFEHEADQKSERAMLAAGYDTRVIERYLGRIEKAIEEAQPSVASLHLAHPIPAERQKKLEQTAAPRPPAALPPRVNREVFRRMAGLTVLTHELRPVAPKDETAPREKAPWVWLGLTLLVLAALVWAVLRIV